MSTNKKSSGKASNNKKPPVAKRQSAFSLVTVSGKVHAKQSIGTGPRNENKSEHK